MRYLLLFLLTLPVFSACVRNNPKPVWLEIDEWTLEANPASSQDPGALTHNFTDVWVYVDNKIIGVFELPCKIPVLTSGNKLIQLFPTIRNNGISATKKIYPFVEPHELTANLVEGQTLHITPKTRYYSNTKFWIEDFESNTIKIEADQSVSNAQMNREIDGSFSPWGYYGHVALTNSDSLWVGVTTDQQILPMSGAEVYLEINYYNTNSLLTGLLSYVNGTSTDHPNISLNAQTPSNARWKKIYIDLKEIVSNSYTADYFKHYFRTLKNTDQSDDTDVYLDNIKVVHF